MDGITARAGCAARGRCIIAMAAITAITAALLTTSGAGRAAAATCGPYADVVASNDHCADVAWFADTGISNGYHDGRYRPAAPVSRGAMAAFFYRLSHPGDDDPRCATAPFPDVGTGNVLCGTIAWLADTGITHGYADGLFRPTAPVSRAAMAAFVYRFAGPAPHAPECATAPFNDVPADNAFCGAIAWVAYHGISYGVGRGAQYGGARPMTRAAMATFLHRVETTGDLGDIPRGYAAFDVMFVRLVNHARTTHGLAALRPASKLSTIAVSWSSRMADGKTGGALEHNPSYFDTLADVAPSWTVAGENVARFTTGQFSPDQVFQAYMNSPEHRDNILGAKYRYIGLRTAAASGVAFNTMDFSDAVR